MKINTKVVFEWNPESKQYEEIYCDSYDYDGVVDQCQTEEEMAAAVYPPPQPGIYDSILANLGRWQRQEISADRPWGGIMTGLSTMMPGGKPFDIRSFIPSYHPYQSRSRPAATKKLSSRGYRTKEAAEMAAENAAGGQTIDWGSLLGKGKSAYSSLTGGVGSLLEKFGAGSTLLGAGTLLNAYSSFRGAKRQRSALSKTIKELGKPLEMYKTEYQTLSGEAKKYRPGGEYSQSMVGRTLDTSLAGADKSVAELAARGIDSQSMALSQAQKSYSHAAEMIPGVIMDVDKHGMQYSSMALGALGQMEGLYRDIGTLKGARTSIDPTNSMIQSLGKSMMWNPFLANELTT